MSECSAGGASNIAPMVSPWMGLEYAEEAKKIKYRKNEVVRDIIVEPGKQEHGKKKIISSPSER